MSLPRSKSGQRVCSPARSGFKGSKLAYLIAASLLLTGCAGLALPDWLQPAPTETVQLSPTPTTAVPEATPTTDATPSPLRLTIWVPPQFGLDGSSSAGVMLNNRLSAYEADNPGIAVDVRIKAASGPGGLIDSLTSTNAAAPDAMPSLIALSRADLEAAAIKGLIWSYEPTAIELNDSDWYPYALDLAQVQGQTYGLPFAGDALILLYRPERIPLPPAAWTDIYSHGDPLAVSAADTQALLTLALYRSTGGEIEDGQGRPNLDAEQLAQVLSVYEEGARVGNFPIWVTEFQSDGQTWQAYREGRTSWVVSWASRYLTEMPADTTFTSLPGLNITPYNLASGWMWAIAAPTPALRAEAAHLAEYLAAGDFTGQWTQQVGYLPVRPSALQTWQNASLRAQIEPVLQAAHMRPPAELMASLGPLLSEATLRVLRSEGSAADIAVQTAERLETP